MTILSDADFDSVVLKSDVPVLVDFWAAWCGPCRMLAPTIEQLATENASKIKVCKANTDECPQQAEKFGIMSIPTILFFKGGKEVKRLTGVRPKAEFQAIIDGLV